MDTGFAFAMFDDDKNKARALFSEFIGALPEKGPEVRLGGRKGRVSDGEAIEIIKRVGGIASCNKLADLDKERRNQVLVDLKKAGLTVWQTARLTGLNRGMAPGVPSAFLSQ